MTDTKLSNPKDIIGSTKVPLGLVPDTATSELATAFLEGALKYGRYNWRIAGVSASIYHDAAKGHLAKWWNGRDRDPVTRVRELASVMACCAIIIDAEHCGKLTDDRPPKLPEEAQDLRASPDLLALVAHLKELFKDHSPYQYTQADRADTASAAAKASKRHAKTEGTCNFCRQPRSSKAHLTSCLGAPEAPETTPKDELDAPGRTIYKKGQPYTVNELNEALKAGLVRIKPQLPGAVSKDELDALAEVVPPGQCAWCLAKLGLQDHASQCPGRDNGATNIMDAT